MLSKLTLPESRQPPERALRERRGRDRQLRLLAVENVQKDEAWRGRCMGQDYSRL
jgi:hypothetical protein